MKTLILRRAVQFAGFTIVELLITVLMIGILASIGIVAYNAVQARTNDDVRAADVALIMDALEQYYRKNGDYPANDQLNPSNEYPTMSSFSAMKALLPSLTDDMLTGPGGYRFYAPCINSGACPNSSADWYTYRLKSYYYLSRFSTQGSGSSSWANVPASYGNNTGWGCGITTYYTVPGYALAWYSESKKLWIFKRSQHGQVDIAPYSTGPVAPQTCTFS